MNIKKRYLIPLLLLFFIIACVFLTQIFSQHMELNNTEINTEYPQTEQPFLAEITSAEILNTYSQHLTEEDAFTEDGNRLILTITINNLTDTNFKNVWFKLELNQDAEPYIASGLLSYTSEKMNIVPKQSSKKAYESNKKAELPDACGFEHTWNMLLTTEEILHEYYNTVPENIWTALKTLTVTISWDGGSQVCELPITL